jgi:hypothetical protein
MSPTVQLPASPAVGRAERWCRASGAAASVLIFAAGAFAPNPPMHGGTDAALVEHFRTHHDGTLRGVFSWALGAMALLLFASVVARGADRARRAAGREPGVAPTFMLLTGVTAVGMLMVAQAGAAATAAIGHHATDMAVARGLDEIGHMVAHLSVVPLGLFVLATGLTLAEAGLGVRWLARTGVVVGAAAALSGIWVAVGGQGLHNAGGLCWLAMMLWWMAQSATLTWAVARPRARAVPVARPLAA